MIKQRVDQTRRNTSPSKCLGHIQMPQPTDFHVIAVRTDIQPANGSQLNPVIYPEHHLTGCGKPVCSTFPFRRHAGEELVPTSAGLISQVIKSGNRQRDFLNPANIIQNQETS